MIEIEYSNNPKESANATLDFLSNRPIIAIIFGFMKICCVVLCIGFGIALYTRTSRPQDLASVTLALIWIFFYKTINRWIIRQGIKSHNFTDGKYKLKIDRKSIFCKFQANTPLNISWKSLKYILQNRDGYIIPITGFGNGGKFVWLPFRSFTTENEQQEFLCLVEHFKLKIKPLRV